MNQSLLYLVFILFAVSCSNSTGIYKQTISDYIQIQNGLETDLKIKFSQFDVYPDITVDNSMKILEKRYLNEKSRKIEFAQNNIVRLEKEIEELKSKGNNSWSSNWVKYTLLQRYQNNLKDAIADLEKAEQWWPDYMDRYVGRTPSEKIAKRINTQFSFQNPDMNLRQNVSAFFILSPDGRKCYRMEINIRSEFPYQVPTKPCIYR